MAGPGSAMRLVMVYEVLFWMRPLREAMRVHFKSALQFLVGRFKTKHRDTKGEN
jgi:hypothetical protein